MEDNKNTQQGVKPAEKKTEKKLDVAKNASVDFPVWVESLDGDPYHENGAQFECGEKKAKELQSKGWVKIIDKK